MSIKQGVSLSRSEKERYLRQLSMGDWSEQDQLMLKNLHVTVLGIGGAASSIINNIETLNFRVLVLLESHNFCMSIFSAFFPPLNYR